MYKEYPQYIEQNEEDKDGKNEKFDESHNDKSYKDERSDKYEKNRTRPYRERSREKDINEIIEKAKEDGRTQGYHDATEQGICPPNKVQIANKKGIKILDTRKTTPGLRSLEKYAVRNNIDCSFM
jgi:flagellar biosynthesis/type III secretory pathway protein FliH